MPSTIQAHPRGFMLGQHLTDASDELRGRLDKTTAKLDAIIDKSNARVADLEKTLKPAALADAKKQLADDEVFPELIQLSLAEKRYLDGVVQKGEAGLASATNIDIPDPDRRKSEAEDVEKTWDQLPKDQAFAARRDLLIAGSAAGHGATLRRIDAMDEVRRASLFRADDIALARGLYLKAKNPGLVGELEQARTYASFIRSNFRGAIQKAGLPIAGRWREDKTGDVLLGGLVARLTDLSPALPVGAESVEAIIQRYGLRPA